MDVPVNNIEAVPSDHKAKYRNKTRILVAIIILVTALIVFLYFLLAIKANKPKEIKKSVPNSEANKTETAKTQGEGLNFSEEDYRLIYTKSLPNEKSKIFVSKLDGKSPVSIDIETSNFDVSPNHDYIIYISNGELWMANIDGLNKRNIIDLEDSTIDIPRPWTYDGSKIIVSGYGSGINGNSVYYLYDKATDTFNSLLEVPYTEYRGLIGQNIILNKWNNTRLFSLNGDTESTFPNYPNTSHVRLANDLETIVFQSGVLEGTWRDHKIVRYNIKTNEPEEFPLFEQGTPNMREINPSGTKVVYQVTMQKPDSYDYFVLDFATKKKHKVFSHRDGAAIKWLDDENLIIYNNSTFTVKDFTGESEKTLFHSDNISGFEILPLADIQNAIANSTTSYQKKGFKDDDKFFIDKTYPPDIINLSNDNLVGLSCNSSYSKNSTGMFESYNNTYGFSVPFAGTLPGIINENKDSVERFRTCVTEDNRTIVVYQSTEWGKVSVQISGGGADALVEIDGNDTTYGGPYFSCSNPLALSRDNMLYLRCGGGDGGFGRVNITKIDINANSFTVPYICTSSEKTECNYDN